MTGVTPLTGRKKVAFFHGLGGGGLEENAYRRPRGAQWQTLVIICYWRREFSCRNTFIFWEFAALSWEVWPCLPGQASQSLGLTETFTPMSTQLSESGIALTDGYGADQLSPAPDRVLVGNALSRGQPVVEAMLDEGLPYTSGPEWLGREILNGRWVLAVSGTHGKTSTASMLAWILDHAGLEPGFLIGGVPSNFGVSARLGQGRYFVVEADEYDSAF